ncbi:DUF6289 family protein [Luteimonas aquatica]|uniref:DUF6289 family protein n=1 Tax=Luteimonas aquatica TaxID=450364 RepID=UPI001F5800D7|nr:DUF6289 family protein [Luteimonas aquatica]
MRKALIHLGLATALAIGSTAAAAPDVGRGEFVHYLDENGTVVGYYAVHCDGSVESWGKPTRNRATGVFICDPDV